MTERDWQAAIAAASYVRAAVFACEAKANRINAESITPRDAYAKEELKRTYNIEYDAFCKFLVARAAKEEKPWPTT